VEKIAVTGGSGFMGSHLVKALKKRGYDVVIFDKKTVPIVNIALIDQFKYYLKFYKPDIIFDLATLPLNRSLEAPYMVSHNIFCMASNLCELLREGLYKRLIHVSSSEVYEPNTPYAAAKDSQDKLIYSYVKSFGVDACIARPFNTYGPGQDLGAIIPATIKRILNKQRPVIAGDGEQLRDFVYIDDTIKGLLWVLDNGTKLGEYDITNTVSYSINEIVDIVSSLMEYKGTPKYVPARPGDTWCISGDSDVPMEDYVRIGDGIKRTIKWWEKHST